MNNGRLLWVDDEMEFLGVHILFLEQKGYEVTRCTNGHDAVDLCTRHIYDLILLDENMPGLSGLETLDRIKAVQPDVPIVMVTKNEAEDIMDQAIGAKIADYLLKPVHPKQILLALKKNIHRREIETEMTRSAYQKEFMDITAATDAAQDIQQWYDLYRRLVRWELQMNGEEQAMGELLQTQKGEANAAFMRFVRQHYEDWLHQPDTRPIMSHDVLDKVVFPTLREGKKVFLLVLDNFRYDQWRTLSTELAGLFDMEESLYTAILPTATQYARNALFAGLMPADIRRLYPQLWVDEDEDEGKNLNESSLIARHLERVRLDVQFSYHKLNDSTSTDQYLTQLHTLMHNPFNVLVVNFIDILSHARTESRMVRELAGDEAAYRSITLSWFRHTPLRQLFRTLAQTDYEIFITTDHGSIRTHKPVKVIGDKNVNTNLRYKLGKNLSYKPKEVFEVKRPDQLGLPAPNLSTTYIFAGGDNFFAYPNNYNYYVQYYRNTFQHGGISMEEMLIPLVRLKAKQ